MKKLVLIIISLATCLVYGQKRIEKLDQYTASNGITYKPGDEIELGRGSGTHGEFLYILEIGFNRVIDAFSSNNTKQESYSREWSHAIVTLKKIKNITLREE